MNNKKTHLQKISFDFRHHAREPIWSFLFEYWQCIRYTQIHAHSHIGARIHSHMHMHTSLTHPIDLWLSLSFCCIRTYIHTMRTSSHFVYSHGVAVFFLLTLDSTTHIGTLNSNSASYGATLCLCVCVRVVCVRARACSIFTQAIFVSRTIVAYTNSSHLTFVYVRQCECWSSIGVGGGRNGVGIGTLSRYIFWMMIFTARADCWQCIYHRTLFERVQYFFTCTNNIFSFFWLLLFFSSTQSEIIILMCVCARTIVWLHTNIFLIHTQRSRFRRTDRLHCVCIANNTNTP